MKRTPQPRDRSEQQRAAHWSEIREYAADTIAMGRTTAYHDGRETHHVATMAQLAAATRGERARDGVAWPEDDGPGAMHHRRQRADA